MRHKTRLLSSYYRKGFMWFRILGYGLKIKDINKSPLLFSERNGYTKGLQIGKWRIGVLTPQNN